MSGQPWVKMPRDLSRDPQWRRLPPEFRGTWLGLFSLARRDNPFVGYLVDEWGKQLSNTLMARELGLKRPTFHRHFVHLHTASIVARDLAGLFFLPIVQLTERRFRPRSKPLSTSTSTSESPGAGPVDNSARDGPDPPAERPSMDASVSPVDTHSFTVFQREIVDSSTDAPKPGENPDSLLAASVADPTARYLLEKLGGLDARWEPLTRDPAELRTLSWLERLDRRELIAALMKADDRLSTAGERPIANPGAWLTTTVQNEHGERIASGT